MRQMVRIQTVQPLEGFKVRLGLTDGTYKEVDLAPYLHGQIFVPIRSNPQMFRSVQVDSQMGTIVWENGADIDPDVLIEDLTPAWMETEVTQ
jgi:hypothetical protein